MEILLLPAGNYLRLYTYGISSSAMFGSMGLYILEGEPTLQAVTCWGGTVTPCHCHYPNIHIPLCMPGGCLCLCLHGWFW